MTGLITLQWNGFPAGYCYPGDPNVFANDIIEYTSIAFNATGNVYYNMGPDIPGADDRIYPWLRTGSGWEDGLYYWDTTIGAWVKPHEVPASGHERRIWVGSTADLVTYDGGDANVLGDAAGPMWEVDSAFAAKFPVGVGSFVNSGDIAVTDSTTSTAVTGEDEHTLTEAEMPEHTHGYFDPRIGAGEAIEGDTDPNMVMYKHPTDDDCSGDTCATGSGDPHNNLPPMYGVYFIKRTSRIYYRAV